MEIFLSVLRLTGRVRAGHQGSTFKYGAAFAIALYRKHGFNTFTEGQHPVSARSNIVMELLLHNDA